jgi:hypothetical protein
MNQDLQEVRRAGIEANRLRRELEALNGPTEDGAIFTG